MPEAAQAEEVGRGGMYRTLLQSAGLFLVVQWGMKQFFPPPATSVTTTVGNKTVTVTSVPAFEDRAKSTEELQGEYSLIPQRIAPIWPPNTALDISIFVSPSVTPPSLNHPDPAVPVLEETNFSYGAFSEGREAHSTFAVPPIVQNNGTLWAHFFVAKSGSTLDPTQPSYNASNAYRFTRPLSQYLKQQKVVKKRNLLDSSPETPEDPEDTVPKYTSHYHPNLTLSFIPDIGVLDWTSMNPGIREWIVLESSAARDPSGQNGWYYPVLFLNTFWQLRSHMTEINSTVSTLDLNLHLNELSNWKFSILASMDYGFKEQREKAARGEKTPGGGDGSEIEMLKGILLDSNVYLLGTTVIVGILHTIFEMLAFKNDVSHWRNKKDNVGISVRTILANVFMQTVIFLYLLDNNENTSWMILMGQGMGILIEFWKITKTVDVRIRPTSAESTGIWRYLPYEIKFEDKHKLSETEKQTQEYDQIAFGYMAYLAVPLLAAYAVYSLYYESHKSWYSFVITTLVGSVYGMSCSLSATPSLHTLALRICSSLTYHPLLPLSRKQTGQQARTKEEAHKTPLTTPQHTASSSSSPPYT